VTQYRRVTSRLHCNRFLLPDKKIVKYISGPRKSLDGAPRPVIKGAPVLRVVRPLWFNGRYVGNRGSKEKYACLGSSFSTVGKDCSDA